MTDDQILNCIFLDTVTTSTTIDNMSGHGVGLSSLKDSIARFGGEINVSSNRKDGTVIRIVIPLENDFIRMKDEVWHKAI